MNKKIIIGVVIVVVLILMSVGRGKSSSQTSLETSPIKIGAVVSLTGFAAPWGEYIKNGIDLAVTDINNKGGINGRKVVVMYEDDHTDAKDAVSAYNKLVSVDKVDGVIGSIFDFTSQPLIPLAETNQTALLIPEVFRIPGAFEPKSHSFVMYPEFTKTLGELRGFLSTPNVQKLAVVHFQSGYGKEIARSLDGIQRENGKGGIVDEEYSKIGGNDFRTMITKLKAQKVDTVFLDMVGDDPLNFMIQAKQLGFKPTVVSYNGFIDAFTEETHKKLIEGAVIINWEVTSPTFEKMYKDMYGIKPTKAADKGFDAVYVLAQAIAQSGSTSEVASIIARSSFTTPNSNIVFTEGHSVESIPVSINVIKDGVQVPFKP